MKSISWWRGALAALLVAGGLASAPAQNLSVSGSLLGGPGPFVAGQLIDISLSGLEPFRPFSLFAGDPSGPIPVMGVTGDLRIAPPSIFGLGPFDGLGLFGGNLTVLSNATGQASFTIPLPAPPVALPVTIAMQGIVLTNPFTSPGANLFAFTNPVTIVIDEPATSPVITGFDVHLVNEGSPVPIIISGTGFVPQSSVVPVVRFTSVCDPGRTGVASSVLLIDTDPGPGVTPALRVIPPPNLGGPTMPPLTGSGPVLVTVDYGPTGLYPNNPGNGVTTTPAVAFGNPRFLAYQTAVNPVVTAVSPNASLASLSCPVSITGSGFLACAEVVFNPGSPGEVFASGVTVVSDTLITFTSPPFGSGVYPVAVRNPDHVPPSPRQSPAAPPVTDFRTFSIPPGSISVAVVSPGSFLEGAGGGPVDIDVNCPTAGPYNAIDPLHGVFGVRLGSDLLGSKAQVTVPVVSVQAVSPGVSRIRFTAPSFPPGLNPTGPTTGGIGNAGVKSMQIVLPVCLNPSGVPHATFATIAATEPNNRLIYLAPAPPVLTVLEPNNCIRVDGGQDLFIRGMGFFTNDTGLPSTTAIGPVVEFLSGGTPVAAPPVEIIDPTTLRITMPDLSGLFAMLPATVDVRVRNPDQQSNPVLGATDDLHLFPSLAPITGNKFPVITPTLTLDTGPFGAPQVFTFTGDLTIPATMQLFAAGDGPLIIRCRGDVTIDGFVDLSGSTITTGPYFHPAGGATGGAAAMPSNLALQDPFQGAFGGSPYDSMTAGFLPTFGVGGFHGVPQGGGGSGGGMGSAGMPGLAGSAISSPGGPAYASPLVPIPVLGSGSLGEFYDPPGGAGGGAGGMGTPPPFNPTTIPNPPNPVGFPGRGGNGGGSVVIAADGTITLRGIILVDGEAGTGGFFALSGGNSGGGGGGGAGGVVLLQAIRGIRLDPASIISAVGGAAGSGANPGSQDGGAGGFGRIRLAIPALSANPTQVLSIDPGANLAPSPETIGY